MAGLLYALYIYCVFIEIVMSKGYNKPNIVLVLTDDQDLMLGGMIPMTKTIRNIANSGVTFSNAFVNSPLCCPSRSTLLTGRYPHNTRVVNNSVTGGCASDSWRQHHEPNTIAALLNKAGYNTFFAGKYLNEYGTKSSGNKHYVPEGWDHWYGLVGNSKYYNYTLVENGKPVHYENSYLTDVIRDKALDFLESRSSPPFFMFLSVPAPHAPFTPADRHKSAYPNVKATRTLAFNSTPVDKHWLLREQPAPLPAEAEEVLDDVQRHRLQSLLAVDELVDDIYFELLGSKSLHNTYFIFTSDNGYHIGQFSQPWDKRQPYDTDIRVPLIISGPSFPMKHVSQAVVQFVDLAPTILDIAGLHIPSNMDGQSILKLIHKETPNSIFLIEYQGEGNAKSNDERCPSKDDNTLAECEWDSWCKCQDSLNNTYHCVRQLTPEKDFLFCKFLDSENFIEAYDLRYDRYQINNIYKNMKQEDIIDYMDLLNRLARCQGSNCRLNVM